MTARLSRAVLGALAGLALLAAVPVAAEDLPKQIRISTGAGSPLGVPVSGANSGLAAAIGAVEKEFAGEDVSIQWFHLKGGGPASNEALANGSVDIGFAGEFPAIFGRTGGLKTRFIGAGFRGNNAYLLVPANSSATSIADLKGKRIATQLSQPWEYSLNKLLVGSGFTKADFSIVNLTFPDARQALERGDVDAVFSISSSLISVLDGHAKIIWSTKDAPKDWQFVADFFVSDEFARKYPRAVTRFVKAIVRTNQWASQPENLEAVLDTWKPGGFPVEAFRQEYLGSDLKFRFSPIPDAFLVQHYKNAAQFMYDNKLIRRPVDVDAWVDRSFVDQAIAELKLEGFWPDYGADGNAVALAKTERTR
jgi:sulfonate transport system substrate-binding protein